MNGSPATVDPRASAITGFTYAYVATFAVVQPFQMMLLNRLTLLCEAHPVVLVALNCLYRVDPEGNAGLFNSGLTGVTAVVIAGQLVGTLVTWRR